MDAGHKKECIPPLKKKLRFSELFLVFFRLLFPRKQLDNDPLE